MEWEFIAPMIFSITLVLSTAGVLILRPLTKRLGDLLEAMRTDRQARLEDQHTERLVNAVERLTDRIELLEERQDFTERMLTSANRPTIESRSTAGERLKS